MSLVAVRPDRLLQIICNRIAGESKYSVLAMDA